LPHDLFILAGSGKIGKSWLSLDLSVNVTGGGRLWDFSSEQERNSDIYGKMRSAERTVQTWWSWVSPTPQRA